jgi:broad specificity phosphatase PhoE
VNLRRAWICAVLSLSVGAALAQVTATAAPPDTLSGQALIDTVRAGGLVIYFRHTATDFSRRDDAMKSYDDCANQRPLSPQGRADATMLGQRIRALRLPVNDVLASPMCRTMEHAKLTFGRAAPTAELRERQEGDYPGLRQLLSQPVASGGNRWIVSHGIPIRTVTSLPQLAEGEAVVFRPEATHWTVLGRITIGEWAGLTPARTTARPPR